MISSIMSKIAYGILKTQIPIVDSIVFDCINDIKKAIELKYDLDFIALYTNIFNQTAFVYPLMFGRYEICELLLKNGANPNLRVKLYPLKVFSDPDKKITNIRSCDINFDHKTFYSATPTVLAFSRKDPRLLELCLKHGGDLIGEVRSGRSLLKILLNDRNCTVKELTEVLTRYDQLEINQYELEVFTDSFKHILETKTSHLYRMLESSLFRILNEYGFYFKARNWRSVNIDEEPRYKSFSGTYSLSRMEPLSSKIKNSSPTTRPGLYNSTFIPRGTKTPGRYRKLRYTRKRKKSLEENEKVVALSISRRKKLSDSLRRNLKRRNSELN